MMIQGVGKNVFEANESLCCNANDTLLQFLTFFAYLLPEYQTQYWKIEKRFTSRMSLTEILVEGVEGSRFFGEI